MANGFKINKQGVRKVTRELQKEFDRNPVHVPVESDRRTIRTTRVTPQNITNYNGPVVTVEGDNAQLAWGNSGPVSQSHSQTEQIAAGYEDLAERVTDALAHIHELPLGEQDRSDFEATSQEILEEVVQAEPEDGKIRRAINAMKGVLSPIALGTGQAITAESQETAKALIDGFSSAFGG